MAIRALILTIPPRLKDNGRLRMKGFDFRGRSQTSVSLGIFSEIDLLVIPSLWYENTPLVLYSAFATQTPIMMFPRLAASPTPFTMAQTDSSLKWGILI